MLQTVILNILALIVTLGILVTIHEFGHFWVARRCGVKVLRFSIGFGKAIKSWRGKDGTEYVIAPIPLGGYVKMLGQDDTDTAAGSSIPEHERHQAFNFKPLWQRFAIVAAGPLANFLLAIFVFWLINVAYGLKGIAPVIADVREDSVAWQAGLQAGDEIIAVDGEPVDIWQQVTMQLLNRLGETGEITLTVLPRGQADAVDYSLVVNNWLSSQAEPDPMRDLGLVQFRIPAVIGTVVPGGSAEAAGLLPGDRIISVNDVTVQGWMQWVEIIRASAELPLDVVVQRESEQLQLQVTPAVNALSDGTEIGMIGAGVQPFDLLASLPPEMRRDVNYNPITALPAAIQETWDKSVFVLDSIKKMLVGLISVKNINGPITIAQVAGETASYGLEVYLGFLAILSISLGVLNLLPIPVLDGGHLLYYTIEAIIRRPVPERVQAMGLQLGLVIIGGIMVLAFYNDVSRLL